MFHRICFLKNFASFTGKLVRLSSHGPRGDFMLLLLRPSFTHAMQYWKLDTVLFQVKRFRNIYPPSYFCWHLNFLEEISKCLVYRFVTAILLSHILYFVRLFQVVCRLLILNDQNKDGIRQNCKLLE